MVKSTFVIGALLIVLGVGFYLFTLSPTSLIPAGAGALFGVLGLIALAGGKVRMHAMHVVAVLALIGTLVLAMGAQGLVKAMTGAEDARLNAAVSQTLMGLLCLALLILTVRSFIAARREAKQAGATEGGGA